MPNNPERGLVPLEDLVQGDGSGLEAEAPTAETAGENLEAEQPEVEATEAEPQSADAEQPVVEIDGTPYTVEELRNGILRQSDYTRKTQELSAERQRLQHAAALAEALESDPKATVQLLQERLVEALGDEDSEESLLDPTEKQLRELEQRIERNEREQRQEQAALQIKSELARLRTEYGDFDEDELLAHAIETNTPNLEAALAHRHWLKDRERKAREAKATEAKRGASFVAGGHGTASGATGEPTKNPTTVREALAAALAEHNA